MNDDGMTQSAGQSQPSETDSPRRFEELVLCHADLAYRVAFRLAGSAHEAEDLVQETFLKAHRSFGRFELREYGAKPWLLKILHNVFFTRVAKAKKAPALFDDLGLDEFATEATQEPIPAFELDKMDWDGFDEELKAAVESLPLEFRSVLTLWALGDLSYKEIAEILGCALGTVMSRLHRARKQLAGQLESYATQRGIRRTPASES